MQNLSSAPVFLRNAADLLHVRRLIWLVLVGSFWVLVGAVAAGTSQAQAKQATRFEAVTYMTPQSDLTEVYPGPGAPPPQSEFKDQTVRQTARISVGGDALKIAFSNEFGKEPLRLDGVRVALSLGLGEIDTTTSKAVTFGGKPSVTLPPGAQVTSDTIPFKARPLSELAVSIYVKQATFRTAQRIAATTTYAVPGDQTNAKSVRDGQKLRATYAMPKIIAVRPTKASVLVAFGDSITAGGTNPDFHSSWPDQLAVMVHGKSDDFAVANAGIGGNRWVRSNMGPCGVCRLDRDVLKAEGVTHVVFALGVNDLGLGFRFANGFKDPAETVSAQQIIDALKTAITRAKARGIKVYVATIVPFRPSPAEDYKSDYFTTGRPDQIPYGAKQPLNGEKMRQEINAFIRNDHSIDGVIDWDRAIADPARPEMQSKEFTLDSLHPNDRGSTLYAQLAYDAIFGSRPN